MSHFVKRLFQKRIFRLVIGLVLILLLLDWIFPIEVQPKYSTVVLDDEGKMLSAFLNDEDKWRLKTSVSEVSPFFTKAILEKEDKYFYYHWGVNPLAIGRALISNISRKRRVSGASTLTMQVVRLLYPNDRTYWNKLMEMLRAMQLELHYSKNEILGLYLNLIPFGSNIEGIKAASYLYLNKPPSKLSLAEAMVLSVVPNKPSLLGSNQQESLQKFKNKWLDYYEAKTVFDPKEIAFAKNETVMLQRGSLPRRAPHIAERLANEQSKPYVHSSIHWNWQQQTEKQLTHYLQRLQSLGVKNGMAMVIDNRTRQVKVYCGSANFSNTLDGGQVDGIRSVRSPGSALKPYLYALGIEKGMLNPKQILYDIPSDFGGFVPTNFNENYTGQVSLRDALQQSLNIPAVKFLEDFGLNNFLLELKKARFSSIKKNEDRLGLSVILGGCGVTMEEMAKLYATLANYGNYQELNFLENTQKATSEVLLDSAACYIVSDMLSGIQRPDFPNNFDFTFRLPKVAWKTGTSFGKRDAWAIGYNPNYTVAVWLGNFSGESIPELSGAAVATPLLFQIFNTIETNRPWFKIPSMVTYREVCAVSGLPKNDFCKATQMDYFLRNIPIKNKCQHLKKVWVNAAETMSYCSFCLDKSVAIQKEYYNYPAAYLSFLQNNGLPYSRIPPHNAACRRTTNNQELSIVSPRNKGVYYVENVNLQEIELKANVSAGVTYLYWYHNNVLIGKADAHESKFIEPALGTNTVSCTDEKGKTVSVTFEVKPMN